MKKRRSKSRRDSQSQPAIAGGVCRNMLLPVDQIASRPEGVFDGPVVLEHETLRCGLADGTIRQNEYPPRPRLLPTDAGNSLRPRLGLCCDQIIIERAAGIARRR
jgi:hypothetical protein